MYKPTPYFLGVLAALFVFGLFACSARADDTLTWTHPSQYTDSSALNRADIQSTIIRIFDDATTTTVKGTAVAERALTNDPNLPPPTSIVIPRATVVSVATTQCYDAATLMKVSAGGEQSSFAPDGRVCKTIQPPPPKKPRRPGNVTVADLYDDLYPLARWYGETYAPVVMSYGH